MLLGHLLSQSMSRPRRPAAIGPSLGMAEHPVTPDGRYFVVRGRLWRTANPDLPDHERQTLVKQLMSARRAVRLARASADETAEADAHAAVDQAKRALGERGPVWWQDGAPDLNRHMARNTVYAVWFAGLNQNPKT